MFWSSLIVLCFLAAPVRPSEPEMREQDGTTLGVASRHNVVTPMFRRIAGLTAHAHSSPFVTPDVELDARPTHTTALVSLQTQSSRTDTTTILTRTSRGPPCG